MAYEYRKFYIDGQWVDPAQPKEFKVINPATEETLATFDEFTPAQVDQALDQVNAAFKDWRRTSFAQRGALMQRAGAYDRSSTWKRCSTRCSTGVSTSAAQTMKSNPAYNAKIPAKTLPAKVTGRSTGPMPPSSIAALTNASTGARCSVSM